PSRGGTMEDGYSAGEPRSLGDGAESLSSIHLTEIATTLRDDPSFVFALLESAAHGILCADHSGRILMANRQIETMFGYDRSELLASPVESLIPVKDRAAHVRERQRYFANPQVRPMGIGRDLMGRRKDGSEFPVEISLTYVRTDRGLF